jgi:hypothetical protein
MKPAVQDVSFGPPTAEEFIAFSDRIVLKS